MSAIERLDQLYERPGFLLRRTHQIFVSILEAEFAAAGLSPPQYAVLVALNERKDLTQGDLAPALGMNKVSISQIVQTLERKEWLVRRPDSRDKRLLRLALTPEGRKLLRKTSAMAESTYRAQLAPLDEQERALFMDLLKRLVTELEPHARTAFRPLPPRRRRNQAV